jgi:hypothetical protein
MDENEDIVLSKLLKNTKKSARLVRSSSKRSSRSKSRSKKSSKRSSRSKSKSRSKKSSKRSSRSKSKSRSKKSSKRSPRSKKSIKKKSSVQPQTADEKWMTIKLYMTYSPKKGWDENDLEKHMKNYMGKVIIWDFLSGVSSSGLDKIKVSKNKISFNISHNELKRVYGTTDKKIIKKQIKKFDPRKSENGFWKKEKRTIAIKKIDIN